MMEEGEANFEDLPEEEPSTSLTGYSAREALVERVPCMEGQRHTFAPFETYCLCAALQCGAPHRDPTVVAIWPTRTDHA